LFACGSPTEILGNIQHKNHKKTFFLKIRNKKIGVQGADTGVNWG